jgi:hypothetical protein
MDDFAKMECGADGSRAADAATSESPFVRSRLGRFFERNSTVQREASGPSPTGVEDGGGTEPV